LESTSLAVVSHKFISHSRGILRLRNYLKIGRGLEVVVDGGLVEVVSYIIDGIIITRIFVINEYDLFICSLFY
jgi:hypothetical protein